MAFADMLSIFIFLLVNPVIGYLLPNPSGKYNVTLTTGSLTDYSRNDTSGTIPMSRELMLSVFQPAICTSTIPVSYMPNKTAEFQGPYLQTAFNIPVNLTPLFLEARLPVCSSYPSKCSPLEDVPILLFSPGYGIPRLYYSVLASAIASEGFIVITIDHPDDANIITYSDGHTVYNAGASNASDAILALHEQPRATDASFIIDQLNNATAMAELLPQRGSRPFSISHVAMLGHSLGGAAAIVAASQDSRLRGAINWDGTIFGTLPSSGLSQPVLFMAETDGVSSSWLEAWPYLNGPKLLLTIANTTHYTFSDAPTLFQSAGQSAAGLESLLGTLAPLKMRRILAAYTAAWMEGAFAGKEGGPLLDGHESDKFPEVSTVMKGNF